MADDEVIVPTVARRRTVITRIASGPGLRGVAIMITVLAVVLIVVAVMFGFAINYIVQGSWRTLTLVMSIIGIIVLIVTVALLFYAAAQIFKRRRYTRPV
jgi:uncharacterized membrane protein